MKKNKNKMEEEKEHWWQVAIPVLAYLLILALAYLAMIGDH